MIPRIPKGFSHPMTIGEGSFSSVYRVRQKILDRWVAVKILPEKNRERRLELLNEARNQAQMSIACIPAVYDAFAQGQQLFIVMEWIKGASLQSLLEKGIPGQSDRAALSTSIVAALAGLHTLGFAHRDIKPANILVTPDAGIFLVDFGFSKKVGEGDRSIIGMVKGTPAYMAPEIWQGRGNVDFMKADLFALGKVLQELSPGSEWEALIAPLLSTDPADRPSSALELWDSVRSHSASRITPEAKASITGVTSMLLSRRLLQAANQLLFASRGEEAYWLLAECLQEDPDCIEALRLLETFPDLSKERKRKRWLFSAAASVAFILALAAAFHFGRKTERETRYPAVHPDAETRLLLLPSQASGKKTAGTTARFRELRGTDKRLVGFLFLEGTENCDSLYIDAQGLKPVPAGGIPLDPGEHSLRCMDRRGDFIYREKIGLLPFQRKIVRFRNMTTKKEA